MSSKRKRSEVKSDRMFVKLVEHSGGKGSWAVYVRVEGNEETLSKIRRVLALDPDLDQGDFHFELHEEIPEWMVDVLCEYGHVGNCTYMHEHCKYDDLLPKASTLPDECDALVNRMVRNGLFSRKKWSESD